MRNNQKLKVALVFDDSLDSNDGVAQYVKTLGGWLSQQGHKVVYLSGETKQTELDGSPVYSMSKNLPVKFNGNKLSVPLPASKNHIKQILAKERFDVVHVMMPHSPFMAQKIVSALSNNVVVVGTFHIFPANWLAGFGGKLLKISYGGGLSRFNRIVSVSSAAQNYAKGTFGIDSNVVPNPVDISKFSASEEKPKADKIIFLGRLVKRKGCEQLLEAFALLSKQNTRARLVIAGDGPQRVNLEKKAASLVISDKVDFMGFIDESDKADLLASASIACFPSLYGESFGIVLIEAMAAGAGTVLGGDNPGYRTVLGERPELLVNPKHTTAFAQRLEKLLSDKQLAAKLHKWQLASVNQYDIRVVGNQILDTYRQAFARQNKNSHNNNHGIKKGNS